MSARKIAYEILMDIEVNNNYSNISLNSHLSKAKVDNRDKGLITELVYGVIEKKRYIDYIINKVSKIKVRKMENSVKIAIRLGVYQIVFLDRIADYAAINESVDIIKKIDKRASGFVNAILRNVVRKKDDICKINDNTTENIAIKYSYEKWIVDRLIGEHGLARAKSILESLSERPKLYLRINKSKMDGFDDIDEFAEFIIAQLEKEGIKAKRSEFLEEAIQADNFKNIEANKLFKMGYISVQDISSMLVSKALNPKENSKVLDLCAAPGGKTTHIAELMNNTGLVLSQDIYDHKIKMIKWYANRLGLNNIKVEKADALSLCEEYKGKFDYVLSDVPCSGMGIVRRKPEIKYKTEEEVNKLPDIQLSILRNAAEYVKEGGVLVYSTCTIFKEENMGIIYRFLSENQDFSLDSIENLNLDSSTLDSGYINIYPDEFEMDGFFICRLKKN